MNHKKSQIIDISPPISEATAVWPGDVAFTRQWQARIANGSNMDLSSLNTTVHIGAHADAPSHFVRGGKTIDEVQLDAYCGPCTVVKVGKPKGAAIAVADIAAMLLDPRPRVLFRTDSFQHQAFNVDFTFFEPSAIIALADLGVVLVGIDTPSVDCFDSKELPSHQALHGSGMANLEGLDLRHVQPGNYELIALPLRLKGFDASPVRAILR